MFSGLFKRKGIRVSRETWLNSRPVRVIDDYSVDENGNVVVVVEVVEKGLLAKIMRLLSIVPPPRYKKIVFDKIGSRVWILCDGKHTVNDIIKAVMRETGLSRRNVELAVYSFLNQLIVKGLIQLQIPFEEQKP